jgi:hypothetical protein
VSDSSTKQNLLFAVPALTLIVFGYTFGLAADDGSVALKLIRAFGGAAVLLGLLIPTFARSSWLWVFVSGLLSVLLWQQWPGSDNHHYLLAVWSVALALGLASSDPRATVALSGRSLIGLAMGLAVAQKLHAPDYMDGRMFRSMFLFDPDLRGVAQGIGGLTQLQIVENLRALASTSASTLIEPQVLVQMATAATWWTVGIEALMAVLFLAPAGRALSKFRHPTLLFFAVTTYALTPVVGFALVLLTMGLADTAPEQKTVRSCYLFVAAFVWVSHTLRFFSGPLSLL